MKKIQKIKWLIPLLLFTCMALQCKKPKTELPKTELEKLPPITQTGANTFGCLVNGVAWLPNGSGGLFDSRIELYVDPTFQGGQFNITAHQFNNPSSFISVGSNNCTNVGIYSFNAPQSPNYTQYRFSPPPTYYNIVSSTDGTTNSLGNLHITRYDLSNRIFSGTFEAILYDPTKWPDTIRITQGRFDKKL
jgi:hypothetical protein